MGHFNKGRSGGRFGGGGGGRDFGRDRGGFGERRGRAEMHNAICSECGDTCEVPFRPTGDKPVYCSSCFKNVEKSSGERDFGRREFGGRERRDRGRSDFGEKRMYSAICSECGEDCEVPFRPTGDKPVYCSSCFEKSEGFKPKKTNEYKQEFERLNAKLDSIMKILESAGLTKKIATEKAIVEVKKEEAKEIPATKKKEKKEKKEKEVKNKKVEKKPVVKKSVKTKKKSK